MVASVLIKLDLIKTFRFEIINNLQCPSMPNGPCNGWIYSLCKCALNAQPCRTKLTNDHAFIDPFDFKLMARFSQKANLAMLVLPTKRWSIVIQMRYLQN